MRQMPCASLLCVFLAAGAAEARVPGISACFTPGEDCTAKITAAIDAATEEVLVQAYALTSCPILAALTGAHARGVAVRVLVDRLTEGNNQGGPIAYLRIAGIEPRVDVPVGDELPGVRRDGTPAKPKLGIAHIKAVIVDGRLLLTGSFNHSWNAQHRNVENLLIVRARKVVRAHEWNFEARWRISRPAGPSGASLSCVEGI